MATQKKAAPKAAPKVKASAESIRVVPLFNPKMDIKLEDLSAKKEDSELLTMAPPTATPKLVYNRGPLIKNTKVYTIFWGKNWASTAAFITLRNNINQFFTAILTSSLIDQLAEYSVPGAAIGHGSLSGSKVITKAAPKMQINDSLIRTTLSGWITAGIVPPWDANTLYFIYMDKGVKVTMGGSSSCTSFCGYHDAISGKKYYAVMPFPSCSGCLGGMNVMDAITGTSSHELCEAITDPVPPTGWYDNAHGEIGDICAWKFKSVAGYNVQLEWSNKAKQCV
ncbi:MAG: hemagglutinin protein [Ferruginibacter sp.]|uniref:hypothetical protein n=1 Tax=Ferruginibacter sp. TaxID=1940288 RepID=UPI00265AC44D|nr:hypothetical protein [Ferruginibacter sp.]MDB5279924.1 hemagglutinin protein [Ferruginibacter sp.]